MNSKRAGSSRAGGRRLRPGVPRKERQARQGGEEAQRESKGSRQAEETSTSKGARRSIRSNERVAVQSGRRWPGSMRGAGGGLGGGRERVVQFKGGRDGF